MGQTEQRKALQVLEGMVTMWEQTSYTPDLWENFCVMSALAHIECGNEPAARRRMAFAQLPPELRPPFEFNRTPAVYGLLELRHLRLSLDDVKALPSRKVRRWTHRSPSERP
jgi:hypothetical protein